MGIKMQDQSNTDSALIGKCFCILLGTLPFVDFTPKQLSKLHDAIVAVNITA